MASVSALFMLSFHGCDEGWGWGLILGGLWFGEWELPKCRVWEVGNEPLMVSVKVCGVQYMYLGVLVGWPLLCW
jgi:hypothetical protein